MTIRHTVGLLALWGTTALLANAPAKANEIRLFVAIDGDDAASGSETQPLATIAGAQQRIAALRDSEDWIPSPITVLVRPGTYELNAPLEFTERDSGTSEHPVTYRAEPGKQVILRGGKTLTEATCVADEKCDFSFPNQSAVWRYDLSQLNLPQFGSDSDELRTRSLHRLMSDNGLHLIVDNAWQHIVKWPDSGWAKVSSVGSDSVSWTAEAAKGLQSESLRKVPTWAHGFWQSDWEDACHAVEITTAGNTANFRFTRATECLIKSGARFRIENVPAGLDRAGEWFLDIDAQQAYIYSEQAPQNAFVTFMQCPVSFYGVSHMNFIGFTVEGAANCGVEIAGGEHVALQSCTVRHVANTCVHIYHGRHHKLIHSELHDAGAGGVRVEAGNRDNLTPSFHRIAGNRIHDYSHCHLAYRPAINAIGVGINIEENRIYNGPHAAIILEGNDHTVARNEISAVGLETDDVGAIYIGGNPTYRGNRITENYIHNIGAGNRKGVIGVYLDDFTSGTKVTGNVLQAVPRGIVLGGGRDNVITDNIVVDCLAAIQADARGTTWASDFVRGNDSAYRRAIDEVGQSAAFQQRYPEVLAAIDDSPELPKGNRIEGNWIDSRVAIDLQGAAAKQWIASANNVPEALQYLADRGNGLFELNEAGEALLAERSGLEKVRKSRFVIRVNDSNDPSPSDRAR